MKRIMLRLVLVLLASFGCGTTIPGQDVNYEPTPMPVVRALLELADVGPQDVVYDLGSGDGRIPIAAATEFGARGVGIEIDPALVTQAQASAREAGVEARVEFRVGDMYAADVRSATVVTLFLHPGPNLKLREKLRSDLQAGARVVSYVWDMGGWKPADERAGRRASDISLADPTQERSFDPHARSVSVGPTRVGRGQTSGVEAVGTSGGEGFGEGVRGQIARARQDPQIFPIG